MAKKTYIQGRSKGYEIAYRCLEISKKDKRYKDKGPFWGLETELKFREQSGLNVEANIIDLNDAAGDVKTLCRQSQGLMHLYVLRNEFGFGKKRIKRSMDKWFEDSQVLCDRGIWDWNDYITGVAIKYGFAVILDRKTERKRTTDYEKGMLEGVRKALNHVKSGGDINELLNRRPKRELNGKEVEEATDLAIGYIKWIADVVMHTLALVNNIELYKFGEKRLQAYNRRKDLDMDCIKFCLCTWYDILDTMIEEVDIDEELFIEVRKEDWTYIQEMHEERLKKAKVS